MGHTNTYRPSAVVRRIVSTVPAATTSYTFDLPAGVYYLAIHTRSSVTGTSTTIALFPFTNADQTQTTATALLMTEQAAASGSAALTLPAGAAGRFAQVIPNGGPVAAPGPVVLPHGVRVTVTKGGATTAELLEVDVTAVRIG